MHLCRSDLAALARLRERFLTGTNVGGAYWRSEEELALYDSTFAERIGWKWDAVLSEVERRGWKSSARHIADFGCGSGVAHRRVLQKWPGFESLTLGDVSPLALSYASARARNEFPGLAVSTGLPAKLPAGTLLLVSHVVNELDSESLRRLLGLARTAEEVIWVEAGSYADSRALIGAREELKQDFQIVAPCPHAARCGILAEGNEPHWCHHFGEVPGWIFQDSGWSQFGRELGIDLTTLPYSYLVLTKHGAPNLAGNTRVIGRPREFKGRMQVLSCREEGVADYTLQKRDAPGLFKDFQKERADSLQQWRIEDGKILLQHPTSNIERPTSKEE